MRTSIPVELLPVSLGGIPKFDDPWVVGYPNRYDLIRDVDHLEQWIAEKGYPWVDPPPRIEIKVEEVRRHPSQYS